jgi:hypothetical protein
MIELDFELLRKFSNMPRRCDPFAEKTLPPDTLDMDDMAPALFNVLSRPGVARSLKQRADKAGVPFDAYVWGIIAKQTQNLGRPVPPKLRDYLMKQEMPATARPKFRKLDPS